MFRPIYIKRKDMPTSAFRVIKISHKTWQNKKKLKEGSLFGVVRTKK